MLTRPGFAARLRLLDWLAFVRRQRSEFLYARLLLFSVSLCFRLASTSSIRKVTRHEPEPRVPFFNSSLLLSPYVLALDLCNFELSSSLSSFSDIDLEFSISGEINLAAGKTLEALEALERGLLISLGARAQQ